MKVNITGKGIIPVNGLRCLAPIYGRELSESQIRVLMKYRQFKVTKFDTMESINPYTIDAIFKTEKEKNSIKFSEPIVETINQNMKEKAKGTRMDPLQQIINEEDSAFDIAESEVVTPLPVEPFLSEKIITKLEDSNNDDTTEELIPEEDITTNEIVVEEEPAKTIYGTSSSYSSKKNKKRKNK